jgi:hypothetical protein
MADHGNRAERASRSAPHAGLSAGWLAAATLLSACGGGGSGHGAPGETVETRPTAVSCPSGVPVTASCLAGQDERGAFYLIATPENWNGHLMLHAHGGPSLGAPTAQRPRDDLERWAVMVEAGYAWAGSSFRQGGVEVRAAAEDAEALRHIFNDHVATPVRTILHGQSWGAGVAAKAAEMFTAETEGSAPYDAVLLTSGVLAGGTRSYDFRLDLRVVYQYLCNNHPRPTELGYALNIGLPVASSMTRADLSARTAECLGLDKPSSQRSTEQRRKIQIIEQVINIPASSIESHLEWATFHFQDIVSQRIPGSGFSPFGNIGVEYQGSDDDVALNAGVLRYSANVFAVQNFADDTDPTGQIPVPVLTTRWINDPTAFVELDAYFKNTMVNGGSGDRLVQTFTTSGAHSYISDATYAALVGALLGWVETGSKPTPQQISQRCAAEQTRFGGACTFDSDYVPAALETRIPARTRP